jgi:putative addiction module killer protein
MLGLLVEKSSLLPMKTVLFLLLAAMQSMSAMKYNVTLSGDGALIAHTPDNIIDITVFDALQRITPNTEVIFFLQQRGLAEKMIDAMCTAGTIPGDIIIQSGYAQDLVMIEHAMNYLQNVTCELMPSSPVACGLTPLVEIKITEAFNTWLEREDQKSKRQIEERLDAIKYAEDFGDYHEVGDQLYELRWESGRRIYFVYLETNIILLLEGGGKNGQNQQINRLRRSVKANFPG